MLGKRTEYELSMPCIWGENSDGAQFHVAQPDHVPLATPVNLPSIFVRADELIE